jgi:hypothetical protein
VRKCWQGRRQLTAADVLRGRSSRSRASTVPTTVCFEAPSRQRRAATGPPRARAPHHGRCVRARASPSAARMRRSSAATHSASRLISRSAHRLFRPTPCPSSGLLSFRERVRPVACVGRIAVIDGELELEWIAILVEARELAEAHEDLHLAPRDPSARQQHCDRLQAHQARIRAYRAALRQPADE